MKSVTLTLLLYVLAIAPSHAEILVRDAIVCHSHAELTQMLTAYQRGDDRGMYHLRQRGSCFIVRIGQEFSILAINHSEDPHDWAKVRLYDESDYTQEVYTLYGLVR